MIKKLALILTSSLATCLSLPASSAEDAFGLELIQGVELKGGLSESAFSVGMTIGSESGFVSESTESDTVHITGNIYPASGDIGKTADIFVVVASPQGLFMRDSFGSFMSWNGKASDLAAARESVILTEGFALELFSGTHAAEGLYRYFVAYLPAGGTQLVYSAKAARFTATRASQALLWRVSNGINEIIIGGTIHLLRTRDFPLHPDYTAAFNETEILVTEVAVDEFSQINNLAVLFLDDEGTLLVNDLSPGLYDRLGDTLQQFGEAIGDYEPIHHNWVAQTLQSLTLERMGYVSGVDFHFLDLAVAEGRGNPGLESLASQILLIRNLGKDASAEQVITEILDAIDNGELAAALEEDIDAWIAGDIGHFEASLTQLKLDNPEDYDSVFTNRNESWIPDLEYYLSTPETEYILVGTGHLVGDDSVLVMLEARGLTVESYQPSP